MKMNVLDVLKVCVLFLLCAAVSANVVVVRQSPTGAADFSVVSPDGTFVAQSPLTFVFPFPLLEITVDHVTNTTYIVAFPTGAKGATLYRLNADMTLNSTWAPPSFEFFDLQTCARCNTMFGIVVTSTYGRMLSQIDIGANITSTPITALPYMWYVNASTFDQAAGMYYGLLNNFPGKPNSTSAQKLALGWYAVESPTTRFVDLIEAKSAGNATSTVNTLIIHFIVWSPTERALFGIAQGPDAVALVAIDATTGSFRAVASVRGASVAKSGPLAATQPSRLLYAFLSINNTPVMCSFDPARNFWFEAVRYYPGSASTFVAAAAL